MYGAYPTISMTARKQQIVSSFETTDKRYKKTDKVRWRAGVVIHYARRGEKVVCELAMEAHPDDGISCFLSVLARVPVYEILHKPEEPCQPIFSNALA